MLHRYIAGIGFLRAVPDCTLQLDDARKTWIAKLAEKYAKG
jgi:hypothetical protein